MADCKIVKCYAVNHQVVKRNVELIIILYGVSIMKDLQTDAQDAHRANIFLAFSDQHCMDVARCMLKKKVAKEKEDEDQQQHESNGC